MSDWYVRRSNFAYIQQLNAGEKWPLLTTPMLYLTGAEDGCVSPAISVGQERQFAGEFCSEVVPNAGHFLYLEQPDLVERRILDWLGRGNF